MSWPRRKQREFESQTAKREWFICTVKELALVEILPLAV